MAVPPISPIGWLHTLGSLPAVPFAAYMLARSGRIVPGTRAGRAYFWFMLLVCDRVPGRTPASEHGFRHRHLVRPAAGVWPGSTCPDPTGLALRADRLAQHQRVPAAGTHGERDPEAPAGGPSAGDRHEGSAAAGRTGRARAGPAGRRAAADPQPCAAACTRSGMLMAATPEAPQARYSEKAQEIIQRTVELLAAGGYHSFSFADIAERVQVRKASIHHHFPTKPELVRAVVARHRE